MTEYIPFPVAVFSFKFLIVIEICHFPSCPKKIKINSIFHGVSLLFSSLLAQIFFNLFEALTIMMLAGIADSTDIPAAPSKHASMVIVFPKTALLWSLALPPWFSCLGGVITHVVS